MATTFTELERLEREIRLDQIDDELHEMRKAIPLAERIRQMNAYYAQQRAKRAVHRAAPVKVAAPRKLPYEVKQEGQPGYEAQQAELERLWVEARRRNGYTDF